MERTIALINVILEGKKQKMVVGISVGSRVVSKNAFYSPVGRYNTRYQLLWCIRARSDWTLMPSFEK